jgi:hypothetical protein
LIHINASSDLLPRAMRTYPGRNSHGLRVTRAG